MLKIEFRSVSGTPKKDQSIREDPFKSSSMIVEQHVIFFRGMKVHRIPADDESTVSKVLP